MFVLVSFVILLMHSFRDADIVRRQNAIIANVDLVNIYSRRDISMCPILTTGRFMFVVCRLFLSFL